MKPSFAGTVPQGSFQAMRFRDRLGRLDDELVIYSAHDPQQRIHWRRLIASYLVGSIAAGVLLALAGRVIGELAAAIGVGLLAVGFVVAYVIWRRRRNTRLTGSPTTWPSQGDSKRPRERRRSEG
jgi:hypothetical protein